MTIEVGNIWPLTVIVSPKDTALQKSSISDLPSQNTRDSVVLDNPVVLESSGSWEKGTFIDVYI
jgi:hypothetical protein